MDLQKSGNYLNLINCLIRSKLYFCHSIPKEMLKLGQLVDGMMKL